MQHILGNLLDDDYDSLFRDLEFLKIKEGIQNSSLDGLAKTHDKIRKNPDGFNKVLDTCVRLKCISQEAYHFSFVVHITVMKQNISEIERLIDFLEKEGHPSKLSFVRGNSFSTYGVPGDILNPDYNPSTDVWIDVNETKELIRRITQKHPGYFDVFQKKKIDLMLQTLVERKHKFSCYAGYRDAVLYNNGDMGICEQVKPFGNLLKWNWDIKKAWNSREAMEHRMKLLSCACIHGCNIGTSISI